MRFGTTMVLVLLLFGLSLSLGSTSQEAVDLPCSCNLKTRASPREMIQFTIGLKNQQMETIYEIVEMVSDPLSSSYGHFLSFDEVRGRTANPKGLDFLLKSISNWDEKSFVISTSLDKLWVTVAAPVATLEERLKTTCFRCDCSKSGRESNLRTCEPHTIPEDWEPHVDIIHGLSDAHYSPSTGGSRSSAGILGCPQWPRGPFLSIQAIQKLYCVDPTKSVIGNKSTSGAVFEVNAPYETYNPSDLSAFQTLSGLKDEPVSKFVGSTNVTLGCINAACYEPMTDVEMFLGMSPGIDLTYWTTSVNPVPPAGNPVLQYLLDLSNTPNPSDIHSISWGPPENHLQSSMAERMNQEFAKLSARGLTFVTSSGDDGVNRRTARSNPSNCGLSPQYPAGSPYVTTVGGTMGPEYGVSERAAQTNVSGLKCSITSGGGFSLLYPQPTYQTQAVKAYLATPGLKLPPSSAFSATNRAYPDVSLVSNNIYAVLGGVCTVTGGTSASAPLFAGMLALILDARFQRGLPPLGLINPALYHFAEVSPEVFNDITVGDNHCTGLDHGKYTCCPLGFDSSRGWDPVTGLGSVNFDHLKAQFLQLGRNSQN